MKSISAPLISKIDFNTNLLLNPVWETLPKHEIGTINWQMFPYKPDVSVAIACSDDEIYLKYWVTEDGTRGLVANDNGNVFTDSCVELFIDPSGDGSYYNFEFNCIGKLLLGHGTSRHNRERAGESILKMVRRYTSVGTAPIGQIEGKLQWEIAVAIPLGAFFKHAIVSISGKTTKANFQKCGDEMPVPHYVTWNPIETPKPDYHRPEFFGELNFGG